VEHLVGGTTQSKVLSFVYELFRGKDLFIFYGLGYLTIRNSEILVEGFVCMLGKRLKSKLVENKPKDYSANTILYTQN